MTVEKEHKCPECGIFFNGPQGLGSHRSKAHNVVGTSKNALNYHAAKAKNNGYMSSTLSDAIAQKIIDKVLYHAANPIIQVRVEPDPQYAINIEKLQNLVENLEKENEELKHQVQSLQKSRQRFVDNPLTQQIKEILTPNEWAKLMQETPQGAD